MLYEINKLAKLGDAIAISNLKLSITDPLTGEGGRRCIASEKMVDVGAENFTNITGNVQKRVKLVSFRADLL